MINVEETNDRVQPLVGSIARELDGVEAGDAMLALLFLVCKALHVCPDPAGVGLVAIHLITAELVSVRGSAPVAGNA